MPPVPGIPIDPSPQSPQPSAALGGDAPPEKSPTAAGAASGGTSGGELLAGFAERVEGAGVIALRPDPARYGRSTDGHPRWPALVVEPQSLEEVQLVVRLARDHRVGVYPISRGCNWGYGDAAPAFAGQVVIDLGRMNRILEINEELGYCVLEPGVTQQQLFDALQSRGGGLWMDATGAGPDASVVGNTLDRGFGHTRYGDHFQTACGMQVVLPDGEVLHTGFGRYPDAKAHRVYPYGIGPCLDGLFSQSNLGVVTRLGLWLQPRPEAFSAFFFSAPADTDLEALVNRLAPLRRAGLLPSALHIANDLRVLSARSRYPWSVTGGATPLPEAVRQQLRRQGQVGAWNGLGAITGTKGSVRAVEREVRRALKGFRVMVLNDRKLALAERAIGALNRVGLGRGLGEQLEIVRPAYDLLQGRPSREHLKGALWRVRGELESPTVDPLSAHAGLIWVSPVLPMTGGHAREVLSLIDPVYTRFGFETLVTFTMLNERSLVAVTNVAFDTREAEEVDRAGACYRAVSEVLRSAGYHPYRAGPMGYRSLGSAGDGFDRCVGLIKDALDPANIMSPGRYSPRG